MIKFLLKGLLRDKHRSLLPVIVVSLGVMLTVVIHTWVTGVMGDMIDINARFTTGHVKIMSRAYAENINQLPNDLALLGVDSLMTRVHKQFPNIHWVQRIKFGGLLDIPDSSGETKSQGPAIGMAIDLLTRNSREIERMNIKKSLFRGKMPSKSGEILISDEFANKLDVGPGDPATLISSTMYGSMAMGNFIISGTVKFGIGVMDRGSIIMDIRDAQTVLNMEDAAGEILGYFSDNLYHDERAIEITNRFNSAYAKTSDEFAPVMKTLKQQNDLADLIDYMAGMIAIFISFFIFAMSIVLWNAGLIAGLRRYGEVGVRLAIGEYKGHIYRSMIIESVLVGLSGSIIGTATGLLISYYLQTVGLDVSGMIKNATMMLPNVYRANITTPAFYLGFIPGLFSTVLGTALSGIGIYRRQTAQLFKELEA